MELFVMNANKQIVRRNAVEHGNTPSGSPSSPLRTGNLPRFMRTRNLCRG